MTDNLLGSCVYCPSLLTEYDQTSPSRSQNIFNKTCSPKLGQSTFGFKDDEKERGHFDRACATDPATRHNKCMIVFSFLCYWSKRLNKYV